MYANVVMMNDRRMYSSFFREEELPEMIERAKSLATGVIAIEKAHAGEPPVWERPKE